VVLERTVRELRGVACMGMVDIAPDKQQIISSRSFGRYVTDLQELEEAVSVYMSRAAEKLRRQDSVAATVHVYIRTNPHKADEPQYSPGTTIALASPTADSRRLVEAALAALRRIYRSGYRYQKAGVALSGIAPASVSQGSLFADAHDPAKSFRLASDGVVQGWRMKAGNRSPAYTSNWSELPVAASQGGVSRKKHNPYNKYVD
jgi:DNA polymerase V